MRKNNPKDVISRCHHVPISFDKVPSSARNVILIADMNELQLLSLRKYDMKSYNKQKKGTPFPLTAKSYPSIAEVCPANPP
jgi:hypothetical protein